MDNNKTLKLFFINVKEKEQKGKNLEKFFR